MKEIYTSIYNFLIVLKVACPVISFLYALMWFISFFQLSAFAVMSIPFEPFAIFIKSVYDLNFIFEGRVIDMTYIIASGLFIVFHYILGFFANRVIDLYNLEEMRIIKKKGFEEKTVNSRLQKDFDEEISRYARFTILFSLVLKPAYNLSVSRKGEFDTIKKEFYSHIVRNVSSRHKNSKGIISDKMFLVCEDFKNFDVFLLDFINEIKKFNAANAQKDIVTEFSVSLDAIKEGANVFKAMEFLEKIDSFNYKNKVITTSAFKVRYETNKESLFKIVPLGTSRFFEEPDDFIDFELFKLKLKKKS